MSRQVTVTTPAAGPMRARPRQRASRVARRLAASIVHQVGRRLPDGARRELASELLGYQLWRLPGHYYSPLPDPGVAEQAAVDAALGPWPIDVDLHEDDQLALLEQLEPLAADVAFPVEPTPGHRFYHENSQLPYGDAILLSLLLRHWTPSRIVEVGSGYSTAVILDTIDDHFDTPPQVTSIEPFPDRLHEVVGSFPDHFELRAEPVQTAGFAPFEQLDTGDVLFIDSTHVAKAGSDVLHELFQVLPRLKAGVHVHLHDICWPFEYPAMWARQGRAWNELYVVHALLANSDAYRIELFNHMMLTVHREWFDEHMPRCLTPRVRFGSTRDPAARRTGSVVSGEPGDVAGHGLWLLTTGAQA